MHPGAALRRPRDALARARSDRLYRNTLKVSFHLHERRFRCLGTQRKRQVQETVDLFRTREEAESAVRQVLQDEPRLVGDAFVAEIELEDPSLLSGHRHGAPPGVGSFR